MRPGIVTDPWTTEEELILTSAHKKYGNKWAEIAKLLPGRYVLLSSKHILFIAFNCQEMKLSDRTRYRFLFFFCSCHRTENAIKNLWNSSLKNRSNCCSTSCPDQCSSPANRERRSRSPEAKLAIDLLHPKQRSRASPREVAKHVTNQSVEIASDETGIAARASTCERY